MARPEEQEPQEAGRQAFKRAMEVLQLAEHQRDLILGGPEGQLDRVGMFLAVYEEVGHLLGDPVAWLNAPNRGTPFGGKEPLAFILEDPEKNLVGTLQYLRGASGGWA